MYRSVTSDPHRIAQLGKSFQELTLNFQKPAYEIRGGPIPGPWPGVPLAVYEGRQPKTTSYFRSLRRPGPQTNCTKKNPRTGRGRGFPCDSARRGKASRRIDRGNIARKGMYTSIGAYEICTWSFKKSQPTVFLWASSHISTLSVFERSAPWSQRVWHL
jgi:hypothetical protein